MANATKVAGVSINDLTDPERLDVSGNAALNGVPVTVVAVDADLGARLVSAPGRPRPRRSRARRVTSASASRNTRHPGSGTEHDRGVPARGRVETGVLDRRSELALPTLAGSCGPSR